MAKTLTLDEQIIEDTKKLEEAADKPDQDEEEIVDETEEETEEEEKPEVKEEPVKEEPKPEPVKPSIDPETAFQLRDAKRREAEKDAKIAELMAPKPEPKAIAPDPNEDPVGYVAFKTAELERKTADLDAWRQSQEREKQSQNQLTAATQELGGYIQRFAATKPDFQDVAVHVEKTLAKVIRADNPGISSADLTKAVDQRVLLMASKAVNAGIDPAAYLYHVGTTEFEYKPKEPEAPKPKAGEKPDLKVVDKNRRKSANGLSGASGKTGTSIKDLETMSIAEMEEDEEAASLMGFR